MDTSRDTSDPAVAEPGRIIGFVGAGGGAGASTLVSGLSYLAGAAGRAVVALDCDPSAGGLDVVSGCDCDPGVRWADLRGAGDGAIDGAGLLERLPTDAGGGRLLSHGRTWSPVADALTERVVTGLSAVTELVLLDLADPAAGSTLLGRCDEIVVVALGSAPGLAASVVLADRLPFAATFVIRDLPPAAAAGVRAGLGPHEVQLMHTDPKVQIDLERGLPPGARSRSTYGRWCAQFLRDLLADDVAA